MLVANRVLDYETGFAFQGRLRVLQWPFEDGVGCIGKMLFARQGKKFDYDLKQLRFSGDLLMEIGAGVELATALMPHLFLPLACAANVAKGEILRKLYDLVGERTAADDEKPIKQKKKPAKAEVQAKVVDVPTAVPSEEELNPFLIFPKPEENLKVHTEVFFSDRSVLRVCNTKEMLDKHLKATGGRVFSRFPHNRIDTYIWVMLRFDDTNPETEKKEYIDHIKEIVQWMGWEPFKVCLIIYGKINCYKCFEKTSHTSYCK
ncbi:hypothetical protein IFM89_036425 [Coptis chinensis]|uniref:Uncharacterized protein n=1 Tax=Coptis chinensis TaxID=261450 RepID=A0A835II30_9MAGN|nr:hypothetical protein IFM89_036425 [Coptis chinensis]